MEKPQRITSVNKFINEIMKNRKEQIADNAQQWFFRGQKNSLWDVRPNIFRGDGLNTEHLCIDRAQRQNPVEFHDCTDNFELLTKLQHYGLGTRLLDMTLNPLVALYFASEPSCEYCKNSNGQFSLKEHDGTVYYRFVNGCSLKDIQIRIALVIPFVEFGKSMSLEKFCTYLKDTRTITASEYDQLIDDDYNPIAELLQRNSFIVASNSNARLRQQMGAFLISSSVNIKNDSEMEKFIILKAKSDLSREFEGNYIIPQKYKSSIREELDFFNVNEATLFPEFEHQMRYIQGQFDSNIGLVEEYKRYDRCVDKQTSANYDKAIPNVSEIIKQKMPTISNSLLKQIDNNVYAIINTIDWNLKDSVISKLRRTIKKDVLQVCDTIEADKISNKIVDELLK